MTREQVLSKLISLLGEQQSWKISSLIQRTIDDLSWDSVVAKTQLAWTIDTLVEAKYLERAGQWVNLSDQAYQASGSNDAAKDQLIQSLKKELEDSKKLTAAAIATGIAAQKQADEAKMELLAAGPREIVLKIGSLQKMITKTCHAVFAKVLRLAAARRNILLIGPAGTGKTYLAEQVAEALGLPFSHISCSAGMSEGQLTGRLLPVGKGGQFQYVRSEFVRCYEEGGVFLFDEIDAADSNTMLVLNSALANGSMCVSNRSDNPIAKKHKDFICIAAANTYGTGADRQYVGRNQMDESTLDRFRIGQVEMDYDANTEKALCPDDALRTRLLGYRVKVRAAKLRRVVSMRFLADAQIMKDAGFTDTDIDQALFCGWSKDEISKVKGTV